MELNKSMPNTVPGSTRTQTSEVLSLMWQEFFVRVLCDLQQHELVTWGKRGKIYAPMLLVCAVLAFMTFTGLINLT
jgi:hypothetical protein